MTELRIPSLQHLSRNWRVSPDAICRDLVRLALDPPRFSYNQLNGAIRDLFVFGIPYDQVIEGIRKIKRPAVRANLLDIMPLVRTYFSGKEPDFFQTVGKRYYPIGRGLLVPFEPPMIYGIGGQLYFPWFSYWRQNPLSNERLELFVTLVKEVMMQDPDLENARFEILDFSSPYPKSPRELKIINSDKISLLNSKKKEKMLETFADGFLRAVAELEKRKERTEKTQPPNQTPNPNQFDLFETR